MSRKIARLELFKIVFEAEMNNITPDLIIENFLQREEIILSSNGIEFLNKYVKGISTHNGEIEKIIDENMEGWDLKRIGKVEQALLKCGTYEIKYEDTGIEIIVNELVEIAKVYGDEKSYEFINGVLGRIIKTVSRNFKEK